MHYEFADYSYDAERGLAGPAGRIPLRRHDSRLLKLLLEADGRTVGKDRIASIVWGGSAITDDSIFQAVRRLRAAMPASPGTEVIQTVHGVGLRLGTPVRRQPMTKPPHSQAYAPSPNVEATASLVSARELSARRGARDIFAAVEAAGRALAIDPGYVAAWCALSDFHVLQAGRMIAPPREAGAAAVAAAERAIALDPACTPALATRGWVRAVIELDVERGLADFEAALGHDDRHWFARGLHGWALIAAGRLTDAVAEMRASLELNPWAGWGSGVLAQYLYFAGDEAQALAQAREAVQRFPEIEISHQMYSIVASGLGRHEEAIAAGRRAVELAPDTPLVHSALACALARAGQAPEARELIARLEQLEYPVAAAWLASAHLALGNRAQALESLRLAKDCGAPQYVLALVDPRLGGLRVGAPAAQAARA